ncbi:glycoside hydrolase family 18 protein [Amycolatopsis thermophila]|uniref:Chitinase n=1 Tax=Amycolatopsis thermophila TaxID=206084 RepID=A0ABU0F7S3_9PSEU|nr:carbohydrate-binding protein CenC [Amycolatopsis thermophila]MDQ0383166.1 chitinase [Amycolatopsis thermophila]
MRHPSGSSRRPGATSGPLVAVCVLLLAACASPTPAEPRAHTPVESYVDVSFQPTGMADAVRNSPVRRFALAFLLAHDGRCEPVWGAGRPLSDPGLAAEIAAVRAAGGEITVATGGAVGDYLESRCASAADLATAYTAALDATGADGIDVDIETGVPTGLVADALARLQRERGTGVTLTLPVADAGQGLEESGLRLVRAVAERGTNLTVNAMLMNFPVSGTWRGSLLGAADAVAAQLTGLGLGHDRLALTIMAGRNDTGVTTTVDDARAVRDYADAHRIAFLGLWSLARDDGGCPGRPQAVATCSGLAQAPYDFVRTLTEESA